MGDEFEEPFDSRIFPIYDTLGIFGVVVYITSYAALQLGWVSGRGYLYPLLNGTAATFVLISLVPAFHLASAIIQALWIIISIFGISRLYLLSRRAIINRDEKELLAAIGIDLPNYLARVLLDTGRWHTSPAGTILTRQDQPVRHLFYLRSGRASADIDGNVVAEFGPDLYVGEFAAIARALALGTVVLTEESRYYAFDIPKLAALCEKDPEISDAVEKSIFRHTGVKLRSIWEVDGDANHPLQGRLQSDPE